MNRIPLYHADVFTLQNVGTDAEVNDLLKQIRDENIAHPDTTARTNHGCWRSNKFWNNMNWLGTAVADLVDQAVDYYTTVDPTFKKPTGQHKFDLWTNVNDTGSRNVFHAHKTANFSAVYYLRAENTGNLRFANPANLLTDCNPAGPFTRDFYFTPKDKDLILWPAWMPHEVEPNPNSQVRVNIAFDIYLSY